MKLEFSPAALRGIKKMPAKDRAALVEKIESFARGEKLPPKVLNIFTHDTGRIRHGDWRAVYRLVEAEGVVLIEDAGHRKDIYE
jgi:mRNA interferase RelE/StbE